MTPIGTTAPAAGPSSATGSGSSSPSSQYSSLE
jgi:hypothetical protein